MMELGHETLVAFAKSWGLFYLIALSVAFLPAQLAVNRMHDKLSGNRARQAATAGELCWLVVGLAFLLTAARGALS